MFKYPGGYRYMTPSPKVPRLQSIVIWLFNRILLMSCEYSISKDSFTVIPTSQILKFLKLMLYLFIRRKHYAYID